MTAPTENTGDEGLRERIILLLGNALYTGKSIEQISKITNKQLQPFENATDSIMALIRQDRRELLEVVYHELMETVQTKRDDPDLKWHELYEPLLKRLSELQHLTGLDEGEADHDKV